MGVWANGPDPRRVDIPGIMAAIRPTIQEWYNAHIQVFDPRRSSSAHFDPINDTGGRPSPVIVMDSGRNGALVSPIRGATRADVGGQPTGIIGVRFQIADQVAVVPGTVLRAGLLVRVLDGGQSKMLEQSLYSLSEVIDGSISANQIFEATAVTAGGLPVAPANSNLPVTLPTVLA